GSLSPPPATLTVFITPLTANFVGTRHRGQGTTSQASNMIAGRISARRAALQSTLTLRKTAVFASTRPLSATADDIFAAKDTFARRHIGPSDADVEVMMKTVGV
ncbi:unnamed protein product, partial [Ectocarpus sp. 12 AP-2014]